MKKILAFLGSLLKESSKIKAPSIQLNTVVYPSGIICLCGKLVEVIPENIDTSNWNLICECGDIAYKHPKGDLRQEQLKALIEDY